MDYLSVGRKKKILNGNLTETVFMEQPPGFEDSSHPDYVSFKQGFVWPQTSPRAWFQRLSIFLVQQGFVCTQADTSFFVSHCGSCILYFLVYVDDIILTRSDESSIRHFIDRLHQEFAIKDIGKLSYFLGLEVAYTDVDLYLSQTKYAHDILTRAGLLNSKLVATPLSTNDVF